MTKLKLWWNRFRGLDRINVLQSELEKLNEANAKLLLGSKLEIEDLKKRLNLEREDHEKSKRHIAKMWHFISERHRINLPAPNGSIRQILQKTEHR